MKSRWQTFKDFIRTKEEGYIFTRKELYQVLHDEQELKEQWSGIPRSTIHICMRHMRIGGFIKRVSWGKYQLIAIPPEELVVSDCKLISDGDNLTYIEKLQRRKERKAKKQACLKI